MRNLSEIERQEWFTAKELIHQPKMPGTIQGVIQKAKRENWQHRQRQGRGGGREYNIGSLPEETREALIFAAAEDAPSHFVLTTASETYPAVTPEEPLPAPATLARWQRDTMDARCTILNLVGQLADQIGLNKAIKKIVANAQAGTLPEQIQVLIPIANARYGGQAGKQVLSRSTILRWRRHRAQGVTALAPKEPAKAPDPAWAPYFLKCYRKPAKPSVSEALEDLEEVLPPGIDMPSQSQCYRFLKKLSNVDQERGRRTGNDLRSLMPMRRRSTDELMPLDVVTCDGHSFKAKVAHPAHGRPFHPEVCAVVDCATRKAIGWSAGLAESAETVADALRHAIQNAGIPYIFYTDPGSGNTAHVNSHPAFGRYARLGITFETGRKGNTQARGLIERFQKSCWIRAAKKLPTYTGKTMDGAVLHKTTRQLDKDVRKTGTSEMLMSWEMFLDFAASVAIDRYNNRPHSELPKITDEAGRRRHMTPNEMWDLFLARNWMPDQVTADELADLFRPRVIKTTNRGEVRLFNNVYYHGELKHYTGEEVFVEYEPQDGSFVYVRDLDERLICRAGFEKNKSSYYPQSAIEEAADNRAKRRAKLKQQQLEEIELERRGNTVIDIHPAPEIIEARNRLAIEMQQEQATTPRTAAKNVLEIPHDAKGKYRLCRELERRHAAGESISDREHRFMESFRKDPYYKAFRSVEEELGGTDTPERIAK